MIRNTALFFTILFFGLRFEHFSCQVTQADKDASSNAIAQLTLNMEKCFRQGQENQFFSAFSLSTAMAMLNAGANGNTKSQIANAMFFNTFSVQDVYKFYAQTYQTGTIQNYTLDLANRLFGQREFSISPTYLSILNEYFLSPLQLVDFTNQPVEAAKIINNFINNATRGMIPDMLPEDVFVETTTVIAIVNAIYFRGFWVYKFNSTVTTTEPFTTSSGQQIDTQIMQQLGTFRYAINAALDCKVLQLVYESGDISMTIVLPNKIDGIANLLITITANDLVNFAKNSTFNENKVDVKLPKFKFEKTYDENLIKCLKNIGITDVFDGNTADLTGIATTDPRLVVGQVIQKAVIEVDEEGSKAAVATVVGVCPSKRNCLTVSEPISLFHATHPFFFFISDSRTNVILFSGTFMKPK